MDPRAAFRLQQLQLQLTGREALCRSVVRADSTGSKICDAETAVELIPDGVWLTVSCRPPPPPPAAATRTFRQSFCIPFHMQAAGFVGTSCPELLLNALRCCSGAASSGACHACRSKLPLTLAHCRIQGTVRRHWLTPQPRSHLRGGSRQLQRTRCATSTTPVCRLALPACDHSHPSPRSRPPLAPRV